MHPGESNTYWYLVNTSQFICPILVSKRWQTLLCSRRWSCQGNWAWEGLHSVNQQGDTGKAIQTFWRSQFKTFHFNSLILPLMSMVSTTVSLNLLNTWPWQSNSMSICQLREVKWKLAMSSVEDFSGHWWKKNKQTTKTKPNQKQQKKTNTWLFPFLKAF